MTPAAEELHRAFLEAMPSYLRDRLQGAGLPSVDAAIAEAIEALDRSLHDLLSAAEGDQRHSPLELVRAALEIPTAALAALGAPPVARDDEQVRLFPEDRYGLVPATSRELGEAAWRAHLAWGVEKARAVAGVIPAGGEAPPRRPMVALVSGDLMDRSRLSSVAERAGYDVAVTRNPAALSDVLQEGPPAVAFVDLTHGSADEAIRTLSSAGVRVIAFGPHVDDLALVRARSLGATDALPRSRFFRDPGRFLPQIT